MPDGTLPRPLNLDKRPGESAQQHIDRIIRLVENETYNTLHQVAGRSVSLPGRGGGKGSETWMTSAIAPARGGGK